MRIDEGRDLRIEIRWAAGSIERARAYAKELVDLQPDVILADTTPPTAALQSATQTIPIVFNAVTDPVGSGFVTSIALPGGNITGFAYLEPSMGGKWLELLTELAPTVNRVAAMFNPETAPYVSQTSCPRSSKVQARATLIRS
jgi:putative ABC transport system substrate-binding protein